MSFPVILMFFPFFPRKKPIFSLPFHLLFGRAPNTRIFRPRFAAKAQRLSVELRDVRGEASCLHAMASAHDIVDQCLGCLGDFRGGVWLKKHGASWGKWESMLIYGNLWKYGDFDVLFEWKSMSSLGEQ